MAVYGIDFLDNGEYSDLTYPIQSDDRVYYTTTKLKTGEECIIAKVNSEPKWTEFEDAQTGFRRKLYRKNVEWNLILTKQGHIKYKQIVGDDVYYLFDESGVVSSDENTCEIRRFNLLTQSDEPIVKDVLSNSSFSVSQEGQLLYCNDLSEMIIQDSNGKRIICEGSAGCFINNEKVLVATKSSLEIIDLLSNKRDSIITLNNNETICQIALSPNGSIAAIHSIYENEFGPGIFHAKLQVVNLHNNSFKEIDVIPDVLYGVVWLRGYYPIS